MQKQDDRLEIRLSTRLKLKLAKAARKRNISVAELIRRALEEDVK